LCLSLTITTHPAIPTIRNGLWPCICVIWLCVYVMSFSSRSSFHVLTQMGALCCRLHHVKLM
jgi:hypothetical protein